MASISLGQLDLMPKMRAEAAATVNARFNDLARESLHDDLVAIASGKPEQVLARDAARNKALADIASASTPTELQAILSQGI